MRPVGAFLLKFEHILKSSQIDTDNIISTIYEVTGILVSSSSIKRRGNSVYLSVKPIYKSEIFLKQDELILRLGQLSPKNSPDRIY